MSGRQRNFRKKPVDEGEEAEAAASAMEVQDGAGASEVQKDKLEETRMLQKLRKRLPGMGAAKLAVGGKPPSISDDEGEEGDRTGHQTMMGAYVKESTAVAQDEDPQMQKYIEKELSKRLGRPAGTEEAELDEAELKRRRVEKDLYSVPEEYKTTFLEGDVNQGNNMSSLSEVEVSVEDRLRKIEETENAKRRMLAGRRDGRDMSGKKEKVREGAQRNQFVPIFGKAQPFKREMAADEEVRRKMVVTERRPLGKM